MFGSFEFMSKSVDTNVKVSLYIPDLLLDTKKEDIKVIYLLHGYSGNNDSWFLISQAIAYADKFKVAIVAPMAHNSFYTDGINGHLNYYTLVEDEVVKFVQKTFGIMFKKENNFVAGLSMGGYGASKIGLLSDKFSAFGSFSGALFTTDEFLSNKEGRYNFFENIFKDKEMRDKNCIYNLIKEKPMDNIFISCGTKDEIPHLYEANLRFIKCLEEQKIPFESYIDDNGHDFFHWNIALLKYLEFLRSRELI